LTQEQEELFAAVVVVMKLEQRFPSTSDLAALLDWPRVRVNRVGRELRELGILDSATQSGKGSTGTDN
jgi:DNA-binding transcriptional regulator YhcF (GntR family)